MYSTQSPFAIENVQSNCGTAAARQNRGKRCPFYQTRHDFYYIYNIFRSCLRSSSRFRLANIFNYTLLTADKSFIARHLFNKRKRERERDSTTTFSTVTRQLLDRKLFLRAGEGGGGKAVLLENRRV